MKVTELRELIDTKTSRDDLRATQDVRFVDRVEYCKLLVSSRVLRRCDVPLACVRGVYDPESELRYVIEEELLFPN